MAGYLKYLFGLVMLLTFQVASTQDLKVGDFKELPFDVSARENLVYDVNGNICALIKVRTGLEGVKFFSNLSIEKVTQFQGEYWVYVSPGTSKLRIAANDFPLLEYDIPTSIEQNEVYLVLLIATFPEKIIYRDTTGLHPFVSFRTEPEGANVYVNDIFYGVTPLKVDIPDSVIIYRFEKKDYVTFTDTCKLNNQITDLSANLERDYRAKRYFALTHYGISAYIHKDELINKNIINNEFGFTVGTLGKTGIYLSFIMSAIPVNPEFKYIRYSDAQIPIEYNTGYYYSSSDFTVLDVNDRFNLLRLSGGMSLQLSKKMFILLGAGYSQRKYFKPFNKIPYESTEGGATGTAYQTAYAIILDESFRGFNIDMGLIKATKNKFLISFDCTLNFSLRTFSDIKKYREFTNYDYTGLLLLYPDIKLGIGYSF